MTNLQEWTHVTTDLPERGLNRERAASSEEREGIIKDLELLSCDSLIFSYRLMPLGAGRIHLTGTLKADIAQRCVVTLAPVRSKITETIDLEFWPENVVAQQIEGETEILSGPEIEPMQNGILDVGRIAFEVLSASLDPYPRAEGAAFDWNDPRNTDGSVSDHPFAALKELKSKT